MRIFNGARAKPVSHSKKLLPWTLSGTRLRSCWDCSLNRHRIGFSENILLLLLISLIMLLSTIHNRVRRWQFIMIILKLISNSLSSQINWITSRKTRRAASRSQSFSTNAARAISSLTAQISYNNQIMANKGIKFSKHVFNHYVTYLESVDYVLPIVCHKIFFHADKIETDNKNTN